MFIAVVCDELQALMADRLSYLEARDPVKVEVPEYLLAGFDLF